MSNKKYKRVFILIGVLILLVGLVYIINILKENKLIKNKI